MTTTHPPTSRRTQRHTQRRRLPSLFDELEQFAFPFAGAHHPLLGTASPSTVPPLDIEETDDGFEVRLAIPGWHKEDIQIEVEQNCLVLSGQSSSQHESQTEDEAEGRRLLRQEISKSDFRRQLTFPTELNAEAVTARYHNGLLTVVLPKAKQSQKRAIAIK
ncbi:MAG: Hsp20/alpha crystallin family protein [Vampirovibrionales bacterium]